MKNSMKILSIETSCDDTCIAILEVKELKDITSFKILASRIQSQTDIHTQYGGVYPMMAKREHTKNIGPLYDIVMKEAGQPKVDAIAVTVGPGLEPALWVGIVFAKELSEKLKVPLIQVNHMEGHIFSIFPNKTDKFKIKNDEKIFPTLSLLISGGHTELVLSKGWHKYKKIGQTRDDAVGEAFDKVARMMGLPYPGGPEIGRLAKEERERAPLLVEEGVGGGDSSLLPPPRSSTTPPQAGGEEIQIHLPRPMIHTKDYDFSFSGLKTAVLYFIRDLNKTHPEYSEVGLPNDMKRKIAREFEDAAFEVLTKKTLRAINEYKIKTLIVGGGVSASQHLQEILTKEISKLKPKVAVHFPVKGLSTDNAVMIGIAGYFEYKNKFKKPATSAKANGNLSL